RHDRVHTSSLEIDGRFRTWSGLKWKMPGFVPFDKCDRGRMPAVRAPRGRCLQTCPWARLVIRVCEVRLHSPVGGARGDQQRKRLLVPGVMGAGGRRLFDARDDVEIVAFPATISAADFHTLLRSGGEVHGAILGLTGFGETECALARGLEVVARIGVGYDAIDVPALTRRRVPLMLVGTANSSSVAEHALFL